MTTPARDIWTAHPELRKRAAAGVAVDVDRVLMRPQSANGFVWERGPDGIERAVPEWESVQGRALRWPERVLGKGLLREDWALLERFSKAQRRTYDALREVAQDAILFGATGRGKTMVAVTALRDRHLRGERVLAAEYATFKRRMEPHWMEAHEIAEEASLAVFEAPEFLLLDDVGYGDPHRVVSDHERRILLELVKTRQAAGRWTWLTTNMTLDQLMAYGEAAISRLRTEGRSLAANFSSQRNYRYTGPSAGEEG